MSKAQKIAITGSMGSGKSEVASYLKGKGYPVFSADEIVAELYQNDSDLIEKINALSTVNLIENGQLNKEKLSKEFFKASSFKQKVEALVHQRVYEMMFKPINQTTYYEIPLLFESQMEDEFDQVIVVILDPKLQKQRLMQFRGFSSEEIDRRLSHQTTQIEKIKKADVLFINNSYKQSLHKQIDTYLERRFR